MNLKKLATAVSAVAISIISQQAIAADAQCELDRPVVFAGLDWDSNAVHTAIAQFIFEEGYGCETDVLPGSTIPLFNGMVRGDIDVTMETWRHLFADAWQAAVDSGEVTEVGINFPDSTEAWFIPKYLVEGADAPAPDLKSVSDLAKYKDLFSDPEEPGKGRFYNCVIGWGCEVVNTKKYYAYGLDEDFTNFRPGSGGAFSAAIEGAILKKQPIFFYYWGPTWLLGKVGDQLVQLEEPPYDPEVWARLQAAEDPETVEEACAYPVTEIPIAVNKDFQESAPKLVEFLGNYHTTAALVSELLAWMQDNDGTPESAAKEFLSSREEVWTSWVPEDVAARVRDALSAS
jgi:glycine betaine/proline transport system substrate-binding protein